MAATPPDRTNPATTTTSTLSRHRHVDTTTALPPAPTPLHWQKGPHRHVDAGIPHQSHLDAGQPASHQPSPLPQPRHTRHKTTSTAPPQPCNPNRPTTPALAAPTTATTSVAPELSGYTHH
ncbi:hypothetical protein EDB89DRAFT_1905709 [Lactarius sanguifluus]|nr:hypothetical protein EDB89DRAFT_1905709 [Lactarius sanguifluus]